MAGVEGAGNGGDGSRESSTAGSGSTINCSVREMEMVVAFGLGVREIKMASVDPSFP